MNQTQDGETVIWTKKVFQRRQCCCRLVTILRTFAGIVYAHLFCACNACHFHHTWVVFVIHSIANTLKCYAKHTKSWETRAYRTYYGIYNVPTQEVGGCFDALHRYNSLRCLVTPIFLLIDQFLYQFSTYGPKTNKFWTLEVNKKVFSSPLENFDHRVRKKGFWTIFSVKEGFRLSWWIHSHLISSQHLPSSGRKFSFFSKSKWIRGRLHWPNLVI